LALRGKTEHLRVGRKFLQRIGQFLVGRRLAAASIEYLDDAQLRGRQGAGTGRFGKLFEGVVVLPMAGEQIAFEEHGGQLIAFPGA